MAKNKKKNKKMGRAGKITLLAFGCILVLIGILMGCAAVNANVVHIRRAEILLQDLPDAFDGKTILYASDIDLCGINTAKKAAALFEQLQALSPDLLILGGDYTSSSVFDTLNNPGDTAQNSGKQLKNRNSFFHYISSFSAPLGKYAIASPEDPDWEGLSYTLQTNGFQPLFNDRAEVTSGSDRLWLVGICSESASLNSAGRAFSKGDCVIAVSYSPTVIPVILTGEASDGGAWADLCLNGHTHGGQLRLLGRNVLQLNPTEREYLWGWTLVNNMPILTTSGIGCEGANMRLGSSPEVWLITLKCS